jgi:integrase
MPRKTKDYPITTRTARANRALLPLREGEANKPFWKGVDSKLAVGYQLPTDGGVGRWHARQSLGGGRYALKLLGDADDRPGIGMSFDAAHAAALKAFVGEPEAAALTVGEAFAAYTAASESDYADKMQGTYDLHIKPRFHKLTFAQLKQSHFEAWRTATVERLQREKRAKIAGGSWEDESEDEVTRKSKDSCNRLMKTFKAALNHAFSKAENRIATDVPWRKGLKPFKGVGRARQFHFSEAQIHRLIANAPDEEFKPIITAGWLTGARYGELCLLLVDHYDPVTHELNIPDGKTGARTVLLNGDSPAFFAAQCAGRKRHESMFVRGNGEPWGDSNQQKPMKRALKAAGLDERASFYALRHSHISRAIEARVPLTVIAEQCGTSVRMIEENYAKVLARVKRELLDSFKPRVAAALAEETV